MLVKTATRLSWLIVSICLCIFFMTGCTSANKHRVSLPAANDLFAVKQPTLETLSFYFPGQRPADADTVISEIEKQVKPILNLKLNFVWINNTGTMYVNQIKSKLEANQQVDVFIVTKDAFHDDIDTLGKEDTLLDLTSILKEAAPKLEQLYTKDEKVKVTFNGKILALPEHMPMSNRICVVMKEEIAKKYKVSDIKTYDDYERLLEEIQKDKVGLKPQKKLETKKQVDDNLSKEKSETDCSSMVTSKNLLQLFAEPFGYVHLGNYLVYKQGGIEIKIIPWEQTDAFKKAVAVWQSWRRKGYVSNRTMYLKLYDLSDMEALRQDYANTVLTDLDTIQTYIHSNPDLNYKYRIFPLYSEKVSSQSVDCTAIALNKYCKDPARVLKFLEWIQSNQSNYDLFMYGIKDKNYVLEENKVLFPPDKTRFFGWDGSIAFTNYEFLRDVSANSSMSKETYKNIAETNTDTPPSFGFTPELTSVKDIVDRRVQYYQDKDIGSFADFNSIDAINADTFIKDMINIGTEKLTAEIQRQLDNREVHKP